jgi:thioredoxin reductase (NADPH)
VSWLDQRDDRGYLVTGADLLTSSQLSFPWHLPRPPLPFETSMPGVFAVGHVQHGRVKRVAAAVGDGSVAIRLPTRIPGTGRTATIGLRPEEEACESGHLW